MRSKRMLEESIALANIIPGRAVTVLLDETRRQYRQRQIRRAARRMARRTTAPAVVFIIGGADGLAPSLRDKANLRLSFGAATWPHQLVRVMLLEQLYRAATILTGPPVSPRLSQRHRLDRNRRAIGCLAMPANVAAVSALPTGNRLRNLAAMICRHSILRLAAGPALRAWRCSRWRSHARMAQAHSATAPNSTRSSSATRNSKRCAASSERPPRPKPRSSARSSRSAPTAASSTRI